MTVITRYFDGYGYEVDSDRAGTRDYEWFVMVYAADSIRVAPIRAGVTKSGWASDKYEYPRSLEATQRAVKTCVGWCRKQNEERRVNEEVVRKIMEKDLVEKVSPDS